ncbi:MAG: glycosyltransferase family 4 protein [Alphaproteobacteria bacterium]|nr:glycosyltransferase family 4 protein [Alphaproteobacteria bacterium]
MRPRLLFVVAESRYFISHRLPLALEARKQGFEVAVATCSDHDFEGDRKLLEGHGITVYPTPFNRAGLNPIKDIPTLKALYEVCRAFKPDIIHNVALKPILYGSMMGKCLKIPKIVNAIAGLGYVFTSDRLKARLIRTLFLPFLKFSIRKTNIIVQNADDKSLVESWLGPKARLHLIRGAGVDMAVFSPAPKLSHNHTITLVARMLWSKGIAEAVDAAKRLKQTHPHAILQLVGMPDPQNPESISEAQLKKWHDQSIICWLGARNDIAEIYRASQIVLLPSYREGLPKSLLEACACGLPIITTDAPGCREVVDSGMNGYLVPVGNSDALYKVLATLLDNYDMCCAMGAHSLTKAMSHFSSDLIHKETMIVYKK